MSLTLTLTQKPYEHSLRAVEEEEEEFVLQNSTIN